MTHGTVRRTGNVGGGWCHGPMTAAPAATLDPQWVEASLAADEAAREVRSCARRELLDRVARHQATVRAAEAEQLVAITEWADLHRADAADNLLALAAGLVPAPRRGSWDTCPVDMSGIPVDEYALAELATTLQVADSTARELTQDALELRERLPRTWTRVLTLAVPVWKARAPRLGRPPPAPRGCRAPRPASCRPPPPALGQPDQGRDQGRGPALRPRPCRHRSRRGR